VLFFEVYNELGGGFLEGVDHEALRIELTQAGMWVEMEVPVPVNFREVVGNFHADAVVNDCVLLELKAIFGFDAAHDEQVLHYLELHGLKLAAVELWAQASVPAVHTRRR
jgi:GxxExxY protein